MFGKGTFIGNGLVLRALFDQINILSNVKVINDIYDFAIKCILMNDVSSRPISEIIQAIELYVKKSGDERIFNTIINLAMNEINEQSWFYKQLIDKGTENIKEFIPNVSKKLFLDEQQIIDNKLVKFDNKESEIIQEILHNGKLCWKYENEDIDLDLNIILRSLKLKMSIKNHHVFFVFKKALEYLLKNNFAKQSNRNAIYDCYPYDFVDYVAELIKLDFDDFSLGISTLIECISNNKYSEKTFEMFDNCFNSFSSLYFDASNDKKIRADLKEKISFLENKIKDYVKSGKICDAYFNVLILTPNNFTKWEDWDKFSTDYNDYSDKMFLINLYEKYGQYDIQRFLKSIYMLKYEKMMPEILKPMSKILSSFDSRNKQILKKIILENKYTFIQFISESFCNNRISIKNNNELSDCFENILNILISHGVKEAAIILINFQLS